MDNIRILASAAGKGLLCLLFFACGEEGTDKITGADGKSQPASERLTIQDVLFAIDGSAVALLLRPDGRVLPLPIGSCTSDVVYSRFHDIPFPRPMTHDLFKVIAEALGFRIPQVTIDAVGDSLLARVSAGLGRSTVDLDASPGDAIAIAQRTGAEIIGTARLLTLLTLGTEPEATNLSGTAKSVGESDSGPMGLSRYRGRKSAALVFQSEPATLSLLAMQSDPFGPGVASDNGRRGFHFDIHRVCR